MTLPKYNPAQSYQWNFDQAPDPVEVEVPQLTGNYTFAGLPVGSPLGIPAGPLLNGKWCLYYASLGFDVLTYKTVRSVHRDCYALPNLQPVDCDQLTGSETHLPASSSMQGTWAVAFGMPSKTPDFWRKDIEATRNQLPSDKLLSVSVVGTVQDHWTIDDLANDYATCARWAVESGADCIETNFSCPNVSTCDGQLYQNPQQAALVAARVRAAIGNVPYLAKIGHVETPEQCDTLLTAIAPHVNGLAMTNSVAVTVADASGELIFNGERRGICGQAILTASLAQTKMFTEQINEKNLNLEIIGVGGITTAADVRAYLQTGANATHLATAAMTNPRLAIEIKSQLEGDEK